MTVEQHYKLKEGVANRQITAVIDTEGNKHRLFISESGYLCVYKKGSSRKGHKVGLSDFTIKEMVAKPTKEEQEAQQSVNEYKVIAKYLKKAQKAGFKNGFIESCLALPATYEKWVEGGKKSLYDYNITTGVSNEGECISVDRISKYVYFDLKERIQKFLEDKIPFSVPTFDFCGYDGSIGAYLNGKGDPCVSFNKEYRGCGNGHYYILINENSFIYYDKD